MTSFFRFVNKRAICRLGIISLAHAPVHVTDFPVVNVHVDKLSFARIWLHKLCATLFANVNINYRLPIKVYAKWPIESTFTIIGRYRTYNNISFFQLKGLIPYRHLRHDYCCYYERVFFWCETFCILNSQSINRTVKLFIKAKVRIYKNIPLYIIPNT